jgi:hypothetical protein
MSNQNTTTKEDKKFTVDAFRIELSELKFLGVLPLSVRNDISSFINKRSSQLTYMLSKKRFVSSDIAHFSYDLYKNAIVTKDTIYIISSPDSSELIEANRKDQKAYLDKVSNFLSTFDDSAYLEALIEIVPESFKISDMFNEMSDKLASLDYVNQKWRDTASIIANSLWKDLGKQTKTIAHSNVYFILSRPLKSFEEEKVKEAYDSIMEAQIQIERQIKVKTLNTEQLREFTLKHYEEVEL